MLGRLPANRMVPLIWPIVLRPAKTSAGCKAESELAYWCNLNCCLNAQRHSPSRVVLPLPEGPICTALATVNLCSASLFK